ncbi:MAG: DUF6438 domain-containing protein [Salinivirgaceae bacterium]|jgi:hypothetical protein|nr:DUF6438 domain-containing protein [Salinivirgaceae bacterium]
MGKIGDIFIVALVIFSCKTQTKVVSSSNIEEEAKLIISYNQTCENSTESPEFKIELFTNKQMYLTAIKNLDKEGKFMRMLSEKEYNKVINSFSEARFFKFDNSYIVDQSNESIKYLFFDSNGKQKTVSHQSIVPEGLKELEYMMQSFLDRVGWEKMSW